MPTAQLYTLLSNVVPYASPRLGYALCDLLGAMLGPRLPAWQNIQDNLRVVMPDVSDHERSMAARRVMIGLFKNYFDLFRFHRLPPDELTRTTAVDGIEHIAQALTKGRGVIVVAPHCGNYTIAFAPAAQLVDTRALLVVEQMSNSNVHHLMNRMRQMPGIDVAPLSPTIGRTVLQALRRNQIVVLGGDRAIAANSVTVDFFGRPTPLPSGPAMLALRTDAPLLTVYTHRLPDNSSIDRIDSPLLIERSDSLQQDVCDVTQKIAYSMEAYIRRDPSQWLVAERVWPTA